MKIGIPKETKVSEGRVALTPDGCLDLIRNKHQIYIQQSAGKLSGFDDIEYEKMGVTICLSAKDLYEVCELIVKVKEPIEEDLQYLTAQHTLFCFLHLAANITLTKSLVEIGLTAVAFESVKVGGRLPILKPMSQIAGKLAIQIGTTLLHQPHGRSGLLLGGLDDSFIDNGQVLILGAGAAGTQAAVLADNMGANVFVFDKSAEALLAISKINNKIQTLQKAEECYALLPSTDLLVGAILVPNKKTQHFISRAHLKNMRAGSVVVDISVDQGGCIETSRPTTYKNPTFVEEGVIHFCVSNMPGAVPRTASQALSSILPAYVNRLTQRDWYTSDTVMQSATNVRGGHVVIKE